jgi:hypothetical protein
MGGAGADVLELAPLQVRYRPGPESFMCRYLRRLARGAWRSLKSRTDKGHRIRLRVDADGKAFECLFCGIPGFWGSDDVVDGICEARAGYGVEF